jgi:hypothetical protein
LTLPGAGGRGGTIFTITKHGNLDARNGQWALRQSGIKMPGLLKEHSPARYQLPWKTHDKTQKTLKTLDLGVSLLGYHLAKKQKQNLRIRAARIPAGTTSRSFRKSDFNNLRFMIRDICAQELHV